MTKKDLQEKIETRRDMARRNQAKTKKLLRYQPKASSLAILI